MRGLVRSLVGAVTTASLIASHSSVAWACAKDRDCEGDLICNNGQCVPLNGAAPQQPAASSQVATPAAAAGQGQQTGNGVQVDFQLPNPNERWSLLTEDGQLLCQLPCTRWVGQKSGYKLQLDGDKGAEAVVPVPEDLGFSPGRHVIARPKPGEGAAVLPLVLAGGAFGVGFYGEIVFLSCNKDPDPGETATEKNCGSELAMFIGGLATGFVLLVVGLVSMTPPELDTRLAPGTARREPLFRLGPGYARASTGPSGVEMLLTPTSLSGVF